MTDQAQADYARQLAIHRSIHHLGMSAPAPIHFKSVHFERDKIVFRMLWFNDRFCELYMMPFGITREQYLYHTDFDVYEHERASEYFANDLWLWKHRKENGGIFRIEEAAPDGRTSAISIKAVQDLDGRPVISTISHFSSEIEAAYEANGRRVELPAEFRRGSDIPRRVKDT